MLRKGIALGLAAGCAWLLCLPAPARAAVEIRLGFGGWTLEPLRSTIESRCEEMIEDEFFKLLNSVLPSWVLSPVQTVIDSSSSGRTFYAELWVPLGRGPFSFGLRADAFDFKIPFTASAFETIEWIGPPLAELSAHGVGTVRLRGVGFTAMGRWEAVSWRRFTLAVRAGLSVFPFSGKIEMDQTLLAETLLGDLSLSGRLDESIADIRAESDEVPSWIFAPSVGLDLSYRIDSRFRFFVSASISHGTFYSAGLSLAF